MSKQERKSAAKAIADTAHQIWLAGLGAFAKAQEEGSRTFDQLIREGTELERQTRKYTKEKLGELRETMADTTERLNQRGQSSLEHLQQLIDARVGEALGRLSLPSGETFSRLADQISQLSHKLTGNTATASAPAKKARKTSSTRKTASARSATRSTGKPAAKKPAAEKAAAKKAVAKKAPARKRARGATR